ncbi:MAG: PAS domain-containing protein [Verrucomicrobia bacterium]|nr:PAS domain-containing protein [Verrucomicrobiota bacterium]
MLSHAEYQAITEQAPILIWRARTDKLCDYFNERWLSFRGRSLEQEFGNGWAEGVHAEDYDKCLTTYVNAFDARQAFEMHYRLKRHDGAYRWLFDRGVPYFSPDGAFSGYIGSCVDVTERIEAEQELAAKRAEEVARLSKLIPMCSWCKKIRTDDGYWKAVEAYFDERHETVTHSICAECEKREMNRFVCEIVKQPDKKQS